MIYLKSFNFSAILFLLFGLLLCNPVNRYDRPLPMPVIPKIDLAQLACMTKNIYHEAGNETIMGQAAVARVVLNRVKHGFAKTPCGVVFQTTMVEREDEDGEPIMKKLCQFSWVCEGKDEPIKNSPKYDQAKQVAYEVMMYDAYKEIVPKTALFFHNMTVNPAWPYRQVAIIGNHIFYSKEKRPN